MMLHVKIPISPTTNDKVGRDICNPYHIERGNNPNKERTPKNGEREKANRKWTKDDKTVHRKKKDP